MASLDSILENVLAGSGAKSASEALILALHSDLLAEGFVCVALGDDQSCDKRQQPISAPGSPCLPEGWNSSSDVYALQYRHEKTGGTCLVKAIPIEGELLLNATVFKSAETVHTVSLATSKYVREEPGGQFNSPRVFQNLLQLMGLLNKNIVHKLETVLTSHRDPHRPQQDTRTQEDPLIKEHHTAARTSGSEQGFLGPYGYGDPDRFPMYGDPGHGGGMIFDPMREGGRSRMVPPEFRPPAWNPPGARFDPIHPLDPYGPRPGRPHPRRPGPDPDHMRPPGYDDDMFS
eukprot:Em0005g1674a